jgi:hypothetical protein
MFAFASLEIEHLTVTLTIEFATQTVRNAFNFPETLCYTLGRRTQPTAIEKPPNPPPCNFFLAPADKSFAVSLLTFNLPTLTRAFVFPAPSFLVPVFFIFLASPFY